MSRPDFSFDSGMFGVTLTPEDLFRVSSGGEVVLDNGQRYKQDRPLDWVSITDHAEYLGIADQIRDGQPGTAGNPQGRRLVRMSQKGPEEGVKAAIEAVVSMQTGDARIQERQTCGRGVGARHRSRGTVEHRASFDEPRAPRTRGGPPAAAREANLRMRTVIFRDNAERVNQVLPFFPPSTVRIRPSSGSTWTRTRRRRVARCLPFRTTATWSNGMMFSAETFDGKPMDHAARRGAREPRAAARGDARSRATARRTDLVLTDEFAEFENTGMSTSARWRGPRTGASMPNYRALGAEARARVGGQARRQSLPARMIGGTMPTRCGHHAGRQLLR